MLFYRTTARRLFASVKESTIEINMDASGTINHVVEKIKKKHKKQDNDINFEEYYNDTNKSQFTKQQKRKLKKQMKNSQSSKNENKTFDINPEGDFQFKTKNMKKVMRQYDDSEMKEQYGKIKEAKIIEFEDGSRSERLDYWKIKQRAKAVKEKKEQFDLKNILNQCSSEQQQVESFLHTSDFRKLLLKFYKIGGQMITRENLADFLHETKNNQEYIKHQNDWKMLNKLKKLDQMEEEGWFDANISVSIPARHLAQFKPYVELYNNYLHKKYP